MRRTRRRRSSRPPSARRQSSAWTGSASGPRRQPGWGTTTSSRPCGTSPRLWDLILGGLLIALALAWPRSLTRVYRVWMTVGEVLGWINTRIILGMLFYLLFTPMGWGMRLRGKDPMRRTLVPEAESYRVVRQPRPASHMLHQF
jgi:Saxitoxin biosynthesis operon protein SxtJ